MDRNTRTLIVILVAVATAGLATFGVYRAIQRMPVRQVEVPHTFVVVASHALSAGIRVTDQDVKLIPWPERSPVTGSFSSIDKVVKRGVIAPVFENEPLNENKLAPIDGGTGMAATIPEGMRAISVRVNEVVGVAGFVEPGTHVDVIATLKEAASSVTRVVVSNVQVLSSGTRADQDRAKNANANAAPATVVTLLLKPEDAARVVLASTEGQVMLALRNPLDVAPTANGGARSAQLFEGDAVAPAAAPVARPAAARVKPAAVAVAEPAPPPPPKPYVVEAIRAAKRAEEVIR